MLVIEGDKIIRIPDPDEILKEEKTVKRGRKKDPTFHVVCITCRKDSEIKQKNLVLRSKYGVPVNSFYCPHCGKRNYFLSEALSFSKSSLNLLKELSDF